MKSITINFKSSFFCKWYFCEGHLIQFSTKKPIARNQTSLIFQTNTFLWIPPYFFNGMNILSFPFLLPLRENPKPCVAWQRNRLWWRPHQSSSGQARALCAALGVQDADRQWQNSDKAASGPSLLHQPHERLPESQNTPLPQPCKGSHSPGAVGRVCSHTWLKHWWWRRRSHLKMSAGWCPWYPPTVQVKCLLCKHTPGRFPFKR